MSEGEIGYGKPPKHSQFKKGQSGNPGGRQKGHKGLKTDFAAALNKVSTLENKLTGKKVKGRQQELAAQRLCERAALGDLKAQALLYPLILNLFGAEDRNSGPRKLSSLDEQIFREILGERLGDKAEDGEEASDAEG